MQGSNVTLLYSHFGLRLKSFCGSTPLFNWFTVVVCFILILLLQQFVFWVGLEVKEFFFFKLEEIVAIRKQCCCLFCFLCFVFHTDFIHGTILKIAILMQCEDWQVCIWAPHQTDDGFSSMAASTAKEQTKEIGNCDMKRRMTTYPRKLPILVCLWLWVPLVHDHAVNQPQHDTIISISKLDIKQEYPEKIGHNWLRLVFIRNTENVLFTHGVYVPLFSSLY